MASEPIRIALIGAGRMGSVHLDALKRARGVELAGVVEPVAAVRMRIAADGIRTFADVDQLLDAGAPHGVLISVPSDRHTEMVVRFAEAGVSMLCEKPVGITASQARAAASAARDADVRLQVGYWRRFVPELRSLRERIAAGELGEICQIGCYQWDHELPPQEFRDHSGGLMVDMGVHEFDQTRWLLGQEFEAMSAIPAGVDLTPRPSHDPDSATILATLSGGAAALVSLGRRFPHSDSCWVEVIGSDGYERIPFMWARSGDAVFRESMVRQAEAFARALSGDGESEGADGDDAIVALAVAERATAALGRPTVPAAASGSPV